MAKNCMFFKNNSKKTPSPICRISCVSIYKTHNSHFYNRKYKGTAFVCSKDPRGGMFVFSEYKDTITRISVFSLLQFSVVNFRIFQFISCFALISECKDTIRVKECDGTHSEREKH